jgi:hypothetical protein
MWKLWKTFENSTKLWSKASKLPNSCELGRHIDLVCRTGVFTRKVINPFVSQLKIIASVLQSEYSADCIICYTASCSPITLWRICWKQELCSQSQWPRGLRHEPFLSTWSLGSWVRIPLKSGMSVCIYSVCVVMCVGSGLEKGWSTVQGVLPNMYTIKKHKKLPRSKGL